MVSLEKEKTEKIRYIQEGKNASRLKRRWTLVFNQIQTNEIHLSFKWLLDSIKRCNISCDSIVGAHFILCLGSLSFGFGYVESFNVWCPLSRATPSTDICSSRPYIFNDIWLLILTRLPDFTLQQLRILLNLIIVMVIVQAKRSIIFFNLALFYDTENAFACSYARSLSSFCLFLSSSIAHSLICAMKYTYTFNDFISFEFRLKFNYLCLSVARKVFNCKTLVERHYEADDGSWRC